MTVETRKALGARIRFLRKAENLSQEKLALMVGVERSYLAKLETGKRNPSIDVIEKIAGGLNVTLSELFEDIDESSANNSSTASSGIPTQPPRHVRYYFTEI